MKNVTLRSGGQAKSYAFWPAPLSLNVRRHKMNLNRSVLVILSLLASPHTWASGWTLFSKQSEMKSYIIADVGEVSQVEPPINTKWEEDVYQINGQCFYLPGYVGNWSYGSKAAMLLVNAQKDIKLALFEAWIGSVKADLQSIVLIECPAGKNVIPRGRR